jgi:pyruvate-formate lyase
VTVHEDLRELADNPVSYGQETHGELHADALAHIERCEEAIRKILEGSEHVRQQGLVEAAAIYNERHKVPPKTGWDALSDADKAEWTAMVAEMRDPETKACGCGYPNKECLRVVLRNGPPYTPRPCEPKAVR